MKSPPPAAAQRLILCLDGTWNDAFSEKKRADGSKVAKPTNVLKFARAVKQVGDDGRRQSVYYDVGVGSRSRYPGVANWVLDKVETGLGGWVGAGFEGNVEAALQFLTMNHRPGDDVFIYGFSRGAATARAVAEFLAWSGVPEKADAYYLPKLLRAYVAARGTGAPDWPLETVWSSGKKHVRSPLVPVRVSVLGVWDTVTSLDPRGIRRGAWDASGRLGFHVRTQPPRSVGTALQALAIDEARWDFRPEVWEGPSGPGQRLRQRWFAGAHSGVGGGLDPDGLANVALWWMLQESQRAGGLSIDETFLTHYKPNPWGSLKDSHGNGWKLAERVRRRSADGVRELNCVHRRSDGAVVPLGPEAGIDLDPAVIVRLRASPAKLGGEPYRPANLLRFLAGVPDLGEFLLGIGVKKPEALAETKAILAGL